MEEEQKTDHANCRLLQKLSWFPDTPSTCTPIIGVPYLFLVCWASMTFQGTLSSGLLSYTHGMPTSNRLFWISCLPSIVMHNWMQSSIRQPPCAHWIGMKRISAKGDMTKKKKQCSDLTTLHFSSRQNSSITIQNACG